MVAPVDRAALRRVGLGLGCGVIAPLPVSACGLVVTAKLLRYLAAESAGQCGPCVLGLPALAGALADIVCGRATRGDIKRLARTAIALRGRGDCAHPDGAVHLLESALEVFGEDAAGHVRGRPCANAATGGWFPVAPQPDRSRSVR